MLTDRLENLLSAQGTTDIDAADKLLEFLKSELLRITNNDKSRTTILPEIDRLKRERSEIEEVLKVTGEQLSSSRKKRKLFKKQQNLKREISKVEAKLATLEFRLMIAKPHSALEVTKRRISRLESELTRIKNQHKISAQKLNWEIFPAEQNLSLAVRKFYVDSISRTNRGETIQFERLYRIIETFNPVQCFIGKNEFDGYIVFLLKQTNKVICDNPIVGNAIYILDGNWEKLSQQSKSELLDLEREHVKRVIHRGDWIVRIRKAISS